MSNKRTIEGLKTGIASLQSDIPVYDQRRDDAKAIGMPSAVIKTLTGQAARKKQWLTRKTKMLEEQT